MHLMTKIKQAWQAMSLGQRVATVLLAVAAIGGWWIVDAVFLAVP